MSTQAVELVREFYQALDGKQPEKYADLFTEDSGICPFIISARVPIMDSPSSAL